MTQFNQYQKKSQPFNNSFIQSNYCFQERMSNIKCYTCGGVGHYSRDCSSMKCIICYTCGGVGHYSRDHSSMDFIMLQPQSFKKQSTLDRYYNWDVKDQQAYDQTIICYKCKKLGHKAYYCKQDSFRYKFEQSQENQQFQVLQNEFNIFSLKNQQ